MHSIAESERAELCLTTKEETTATQQHRQQDKRNRTTERQSQSLVQRRLFVRRVKQREAHQPTNPPTHNASSWPQAVGNSNTKRAENTINVTRSRSDASLRCIAKTACATTATDATLSPSITPPLSQLGCPKSNAAAAIINSADGSVKPIQAAHPPSQPARSMPRPMPT